MDGLSKVNTDIKKGHYKIAIQITYICYIM
jgi:hypothetical protein